jgi:hypothetical protein
MKNKTILATAVATAAGGMTMADDAAALTYNATLTQVLTYSNNGTAGTAGNITSSTATFTYDNVSGLLTQTGGVYNNRVSTAPTSTLYRHSVTGLVLGNGAAAVAATYQCVEGNFGSGVGASICGNYNFGANFVNESTTSWGPGTAASKTVGGDDNDIGPQQTVGFTFNGINTLSFDGSTLVMTNRTCTGGVCVTYPPGAYNTGVQWTLATTPVPDTDGDGVPDSSDNCTLRSNANQCDSDADGYGNRCDGDLNNNLSTNAQDTTLFRQQLGQPSVAPTYNKADINCSGAVNAQDTTLFRGLLGSPPGPKAP